VICRARNSDRGSATAEIAVALPALVVVTAAAIAVVAIVTAQLRCLDAAREAARAAARGESPAAVQDLARRVAPRGAAVVVGPAGDRVSVAVTTRVHLLVRRGPSLTVEGRAVAATEPGAFEAGR
jgi:hypothetical protein